MAIQVPLSWLKDFVAINITPDQLAERLTTAGLEVETIETSEITGGNIVL